MTGPYLSHIDGDEEFRKIQAKLEAGETLSNEDLMRLIILPLTYTSREQQIDMIDRAIDSAAGIADDEQRSFVLAGISIATDTLILEKQTRRIGGLLKMTKVGRMLMEEFDELERQLEVNLAQLNETTAQLDEKKAQLDETTAQLDETTAQLDEKNAQLDEKNAQLDETTSRLQEKEDQILLLKKNLEITIRNLLMDGIPREKIMRITGADAAEINRIGDQLHSVR